MDPVQQIRMQCLELAVKFAHTIISSHSSGGAIDGDAIVADAEAFRTFVQDGTVPKPEG